MDRVVVVIQKKGLLIRSIVGIHHRKLLELLHIRIVLLLVLRLSRQLDSWWQSPPTLLQPLLCGTLGWGATRLEDVSCPQVISVGSSYSPSFENLSWWFLSLTRLPGLSLSVGSEFFIVMNLKHFIQNKYLDSQTLQHVTMFYILTGTLHCLEWSLISVRKF